MFEQYDSESFSKLVANDSDSQVLTYLRRCQRRMRRDLNNLDRQVSQMHLMIEELMDRQQRRMEKKICSSE